MIVSYETLRTLSEYLANCSIGLLLCDEGHRLKNSGTRFLDSGSTTLYFVTDSLTFQSLNALNVKRRVILSGTPIQVSSDIYFEYMNAKSDPIAERPFRVLLPSQLC